MSVWHRNLLVSLLLTSPIRADVVINEIMYHPASEADAEEFIELKNVSSSPVNLSGWRFTRGISYTFPSITLPPGDYLVLAADTAIFESTYAENGALGNWTGSLSNSGERLTLENADGDIVSDVHYFDQGDWAARVQETDTDITRGEDGWTWHAEHDGLGASLELTSTSLKSATDEGQLWASSVGSPTPGFANSTATTAFAPVIAKVKHSPPVPTSSDSVTISAKVVDLPGTSITLDLRYRESTSSPGSFQTATMLLVGDSTYAATLPAKTNGTLIEFYVEASDGTLTRTWPAPTDQGQVANALYQVDDEIVGDLPVYRLLMTAQDSEDYDDFNKSSNAQVNTTLIAYDGEETKIRYRCGTRIRGKGSRGRDPRPMRLKLPRDRSMNGSTDLNLNMYKSYLQVLGQKLFQAAELPSVKAWQVQIRRNGINQIDDPEHDDHYGSWVHLQVMDGDYAKDVFPDDYQGNLYKGGNFRYRDGLDYHNQSWDKRTNASEGDYTDIHGIMDVFINQVGQANYLEQVESVVDLDQWLRWFGVMSLLANYETNLSTGQPDDYAAYVGFTDPRMVLIPHDLDSIILASEHDPASFTLFDMIEDGAAYQPLIDLFDAPTVETRYYQEIQDLLETTFSKSTFDRLVQQVLGDWVPASEIAATISWMDARRTFATAEVEDALSVTIAEPTATSEPSWESPFTGHLVINEILTATDSVSVSGSFSDYIELTNRGTTAISLGGLHLTDSETIPDKYVIPAGTMLLPGEFLTIIATDETGTGLRTGFRLDSEGETVRLLATDGFTVVDQVTFGCQISDLSLGRDNLDHWVLNVPTPGTVNQEQPLGSVDSLRINEWLTSTALLYREDYVELYNPDTLPIALSGVSMQPNRWTGDFSQTFPPLSFQAGASVKALPKKLGSQYGWLRVTGSNGVEIDEVHWHNQQSDVSTGLTVDGGSTQTSFAVPTIGRSNTDSLDDLLKLQSSLRVTSLHYDPAEGTSYEYVELQNIGTATLSLAKVRFTQGIDFRFPNINLAPGARVILSEDLGQYETFHGESTSVIGEYKGKLSNGGETLRLETGPFGFIVQQFRYEDDWYPSTDGGGDRLQVVDVNAPTSSWNTAGQWEAVPVTSSDPYALWAMAALGTLDIDTAGRLTDPDADGLANLTEWAHGTDPFKSDETGVLHLVHLDSAEATFCYIKNLAADGLTFRVQESSDLVTWTNSTIMSDVSLGTTSNLDEREITITQDDESRLFYRIEVESGP